MLDIRRLADDESIRNKREDQNRAAKAQIADAPVEMGHEEDGYLRHHDGAEPDAGKRNA